MLFEKMMEKMADYMSYLEREERCEATRRQYRRDILCLMLWGDGKEVSKENILLYKEKLQAEYRASSVNAKLAAINGFFGFLGRDDLKVRRLKIQQEAYCSEDRELTREEYIRLVRTAMRKEDRRLSLLLQTICGTGIRVSELKFITAEAVRLGWADISLKGKNRRVLMPGELLRLLKEYMKQQHISSGPIFVTQNGKPLDRSYIWRQMKALCDEAQVGPGKVFPHNLRHLFARCFHDIDKDMVKLADILGHSNINTTRVYTVSTGAEHRKRMDELRLIIG